VDDAALRQRFHYVRPESPAAEKSIATLAEAEADLIVFDSLNPILGLQGVDTASTTEVDSFFRAVLDPLTDSGACALMLDHVPKDKGNRGRYAYGSERKLTGVDVHLTMRAHKPFSREYGGESFLDVAKDRDGHVGATGETVGAFTLESSSIFGGDLTASLREVSTMEADLTLSVVAESIAAVLADGEGRSQTWIEDNTTGARAPASGRNCIGAHDLRHTYVSNAVQAGLPLPVVAKLAGHRDIRMLSERYAGVVGADLSSHVAALAATGYGA
jgi:hypothetical protein